MLSQEQAISATEQLREFADKFAGLTILSTGARVVDYPGVLYNVDGSSDDPEIDGKNWKELLRARGTYTIEEARF